jgi:hypothetical protein
VVNISQNRKQAWLCSVISLCQYQALGNEGELYRGVEFWSSCDSGDYCRRKTIGTWKRSSESCSDVNMYIFHITELKNWEQWMINSSQIRDIVALLRYMKI